MNLSKLFQAQKELDERIVKEKGLEGKDLLPMKILALQVELGELTNEWRGFKFWSEDQEPRREKIEIGFSNPDGAFEYTSYPLLEEYVDCLHFILSIGLEKDWTPIAVDLYVKAGSIQDQIDGLFYEIAIFSNNRNRDNYHNILMVFKGLGEMLGFTPEQIEQSYFEKNNINHRRQDNGY